MDARKDLRSSFDITWCNFTGKSCDADKTVFLFTVAVWLWFLLGGQVNIGTPRMQHVSKNAQVPTTANKCYNLNDLTENANCKLKNES